MAVTVHANSKSDNVHQCLFTLVDGRRYVLARQLTNNRIAIFKSIDGLAAYTEQDTANAPTSANYDEPSGVIDNQQIIHVIFKGSAEVRYATFNTNTDTWTVSEQISTTTATVSTSIFVSGALIPHAVWEDALATFSTVYYSNKSSGSWKAKVEVEGVTNSKNCIKPSITFGKNSSGVNLAQVIYINSTDGDVSVALADAADATSWTIEDVEVSADTTVTPSITSINTTSTWIAYVNSTQDIIRQEHLDVNAWNVWETKDVLDSVNNYVKIVSMTRVLEDTYVFGIDSATSDVYYFKNSDARVLFYTGTAEKVHARWRRSIVPLQNNNCIDAIIYDSVASDIIYEKVSLGTTKLYLRDVTAVDTPSAGEKSSMTATQVDNATGTEETRSLLTQIGTTQTSITQNTDASVTAELGYHGRFASELLAAQFIEAQVALTLAMAFSESNANSNAFLAASIYVWRPSTQAVVGYLVDSSTAIGTEWATTETGEVNDITSSGLNILEGDILVFEVWRTQTQGASMAYTNTSFYDGTTEPTDGAAATSAASYISLPQTLIFSLAKLTNYKRYARYNEPEPILKPISKKFEAWAAVITGGVIAKLWDDVFAGIDAWKLERFRTWLDNWLGTDSWILTRTKSFIDDFFGTDSWIVSKLKSWLDTFLGTDLWTVEKFVAKLFADVWNGIDAWVLSRGKIFADFLSGVDQWILERAKSFPDNFFGTDNWILSRAKQFLESYLGSDSWLLTRAKSFLDDFFGSDSWILTKAKRFLDVIIFVDQWIQTVLSLGVERAEAVGDSITATEISEDLQVYTEIDGQSFISTEISEDDII